MILDEEIHKLKTRVAQANHANLKIRGPGLVGPTTTLE